MVDGNEVVIASHVTKSDTFGRKMAEVHTGSAAMLNTGGMFNTTLTEHDTKGRPVKVTLPDGTASTSVYSIVENLLKTIRTPIQLYYFS